MIYSEFSSRRLITLSTITAEEEEEGRMRMNGPAVAGALGTLAATVLGVGLWAAAARNRKKAPPPANRQNDLILANRSVGLFLGVFSLVGKSMILFILRS